MKITMIEVEASAEDLKSTRTLGEAMSNAFYRIFDRMGSVSVPAEDEEDEDVIDE